MKTVRFVVEKFDWKDLEDAGYASVTDYCRWLVENTPDSLPDRIEIYRGAMHCFSVLDVKVMATLEPTSRGFQKYTPTRASNGRGRVKSRKMEEDARDI